MWAITISRCRGQYPCARSITSLSGGFQVIRPGRFIASFVVLIAFIVYNINMIARIIVFIIGTLGGVSLIWKTEWYIQNFGKSAWAEDKLSMAGGTRMLAKIIGILVIFFSWIYAFGMLEGCLSGTIGQVLPGLKK